MTEPMQAKAFPLTLASFAIGAGAGVMGGLVADEPLVGFAIFVLFATVGATWRRERPVIFPFILGYQWIAVTIGYFYSLITGYYPSTYPPGDIAQTVWLSLWGLVLLAAGMRIVCALPLGPLGRRPIERTEVGNLTGLFWVVIAVYAIDYVYVLNVRAYGSAGQVLARVLDFRQVLLVALWYEVLRRRQSFRYLWITVAWVFVPLLGSYFSDFKAPLMLLLIVSLSFFKPWEREAWRFSKRQIVTSVAVGALLIFVAMVWQAGVKKETRRVYDEEGVRGGPLGRVSLFLNSAGTALPVVFDDTQFVVEGLVERLSYVTFFSRVLQHVPRVQPHTNGELLGMAVTNAFMPRFIFREKPELPSDSAYTRRFTGIPVTEGTTSISIGYMAEFYADWGVSGMLLMIFCYGCWIGVAYRVVELAFPVPALLNPAIVTVLLSVYQFEHQFIKTFAALNIAVVVVIGLGFLLRRPLTTFLDLRTIDAEPDEAMEGAATA